MLLPNSTTTSADRERYATPESVEIADDRRRVPRPRLHEFEPEAGAESLDRRRSRRVPAAAPLAELAERAKVGAVLVQARRRAAGVGVEIERFAGGPIHRLADGHSDITR